MGSFLDKPKTEKYLEHGDGNGLRYGVASMQGWRVEMEDAHRAVMGLDGALKDWSYFAVFDGHAGKITFPYNALNHEVISNPKVHVFHPFSKESHKNLPT